ncbi:MerR family transcriptional regulator [Saccharopolyspora cebuensis]|uniref:MerR family transcriptional regulator n=1 Tax=Saccharopolyspora cebuensis TaxID=418759 RepID=A0ABV4CJP2_9PSEU
MARRMQIGEVAERTGLSLRTIRYYDEVGLVVPSARSQGGFRLYTEPDIDRLGTVQRMKPLNLPLEEMRELLDLLDAAAGHRVGGGCLGAAGRRRLQEFADRVEDRCRRLRGEVAAAEDGVAALRSRLPA